MINLEEVKKQFLSQYIMSSPKTQVKYKNEINLFLSVCEIDSIEKLNAFNDVNISKFYEYAKANKWSDCTINQRLGIAKQYIAWCFKKHYISENYLQDIKRIRVNCQVHYTPTKNEFDKFLDYIKEHTNKKRLYLMVKLISFCGFRRSEIVGLTINNINKESSTIKVKGKGNKIVEQPVPPELLLELLQYIETERNEIIQKYIAIGGKDLGYIFLSGIGNGINKEKKNLNNGNQVDGNAFYQQIKRYAKLSGVDNADKWTVHMVRRELASQLYEKTNDAYLVQQALRHSNISTTTQCYIKFNRKKIVDAVEDMYSGKVEDKEYQEYLKLKEKFGGI